MPLILPSSSLDYRHMQVDASSIILDSDIFKDENCSLPVKVTSSSYHAPVSKVSLVHVLISIAENIMFCLCYTVILCFILILFLYFVMYYSCY